MKIRLAILERDESYRKRFVSAFSTKYADGFEIYAFTEQAVAMDTLSSAKIDVLLADDEFEVDPAQLPRRCAFAYLSDSPDIESVRDQRVVFKYQRIDLAYKQILNLYAENANVVSGLGMGEGDCRVIVFVSAAGGVGSSSMAAACALNAAARGKRVMYLDLETFGGASVFFSGEGQFDMSDVLFALKSKKANLALKLESIVRTDPRGVSFFAPPKLPLDLLEMKTEELMTLISELRGLGRYDCIVIDSDFSLTPTQLSLFGKAHSVVMVSDGSEISNGKTIRAVNALTALDQNAEVPLLNRVKLAYNRFSNKTGREMADVGLKRLGGAPRYEHAPAADVVKRLAASDMFERIL